MSVDWGSVPDWVAALGTTGAVLYAVLSGRAARHAMVEPVFQVSLGEPYSLDDDTNKRSQILLTNVGLGPSLNVTLEILGCDRDGNVPVEPSSWVHIPAYTPVFTKDEPSNTFIRGMARLVAGPSEPWIKRTFAAWGERIPHHGYIVLSYKDRFGKRYKKSPNFKYLGQEGFEVQDGE